MSQDYKDVELKFKMILKSLPEDKRKELFEKLKSMEPSQREDMIRKIVAANEKKQEVQRPKKPVNTQGKKVQKKPDAQPQKQTQNPIKNTLSLSRSLWFSALFVWV